MTTRAITAILATLCMASAYATDVEYTWNHETFLGPTTLAVRSWPYRDAYGTYTLKGYWKKYRNGKLVASEVSGSVSNVKIWSSLGHQGVSNGSKLKFEGFMSPGPDPSSGTVGSLSDGYHVYKSPDASKSHDGNQQSLSLTFVWAEK